MRNSRLRTFLLGLAVVSFVAGCGSGGDAGSPMSPPAEASVPASAVASVGSFLGFLKSLAASPDDRGEPLKVEVVAPVDDASEPDPSV